MKRLRQVCLLVCAAVCGASAAPTMRDSLVADRAPGPAARHGLKKLKLHRIPAGLGMALFNRSKHVNALDDAIANERRAAQAWEAIVRAAGDVYADDLRMGAPFAGLNGHWRDELAALKKGIAALEKQRAGLPQEDRRTARATLGGDTQPPLVRRRALTSAPAGQPLRLSA